MIGRGKKQTKQVCCLEKFSGLECREEQHRPSPAYFLIWEDGTESLGRPRKLDFLGKCTSDRTEPFREKSLGIFKRSTLSISSTDQHIHVRKLPKDGTRMIGGKVCLKDLRHIKRLDLAVEFQERTVGGEIREVMAAGASLGRDL